MMFRGIISALIFGLMCGLAHAADSFRVGGESFEFGSGTFVHCFFSTVSANLEPNGWGSRFPTLMNKLYRGTVREDELGKLKKEVQIVKVELQQLPPSKVVWDIADRGKQPPWGNNVAPTVTNLGNYFMTSDGKDLFEVFFGAIAAAQKNGVSIVIE